MPISGEVVEVNAKLESNPELVNSDAYGEGWLVKISVQSPSELDRLMDAEAYKKLIGV